MKKLFVILIVVLARTTIVCSDDRYIWLHGLEGQHGANTWDIYNAMFTGQQGHVLEYESDKSIATIARNLYRNKIQAMDTSGSMVVIGHSMGGLVARSLLKHSANFKGVITVGTSNNGSVLLMNTVNGKVYDFFSNAINMANSAIDASLYSGIISGFPVTTLAAPLIVPVTIFKNKTVNTTLFLLKQVMNAGIGIYKFGHPCIRDMIPGSDFLVDLNSKPHNVPMLNVYGAEDHWQVVRALSSLSKVDAVKNPANTDVSYDMEYFSALQSGLAFIYQVQTTHNLVYNALGVAAVFMPWIWITREMVLKARYNWDGIYRYLETGIHTDLAGVMGATRFQLQNYCIPAGLSLTKLTCKTVFLPVVTENDGILSRMDVVLPSDNKQPVFNIKLAGVNHQEMGNHIAVRKLLNEVINFKSYGDAFAK